MQPSYGKTWDLCACGRLKATNSPRCGHCRSIINNLQSRFQKGSEPWNKAIRAKRLTEGR